MSVLHTNKITHWTPINALHTRVISAVCRPSKKTDRGLVCRTGAPSWLGVYVYESSEFSSGGALSYFFFKRGTIGLYVPLCRKGYGIYQEEGLA